MSHIFTLTQNGHLTDTELFAFGSGYFILPVTVKNRPREFRLLIGLFFFFFFFKKWGT